MKIKKWEWILFGILLLITLASQSLEFGSMSGIIIFLILYYEKRQEENRQLIAQGIDPFYFRTRKKWESWKNREKQDCRGSISRRARACRGELNPIKIDVKRFTGTFAATNGRGKYLTTINGCSCPDFSKRKLPCKHMHYLADICCLNGTEDYAEYLAKALDYPNYGKDSEEKIREFQDARDIAEKMLGDKIIGMIKEEGGFMKQVDIKKQLNYAELKYFDYTIGLLLEADRIERNKEGGKIIFNIKL